jgi:hypothetical protein
MLSIPDLYDIYWRNQPLIKDICSVIGNVEVLTSPSEIFKMVEIDMESDFEVHQQSDFNPSFIRVLYEVIKPSAELLKKL